MLLHQDTVRVATTGSGFTDVTSRVAQVVRASRVDRGLCSVFVRHTSASLVIQENADPAVLRDLARWMQKLAPRGGSYEHDDEGPDDMPAHLASSITRTSEVIPVGAGALLLGTWQAVYLWEHRSAPHERELVVTVWGPAA